MVNVSQNVQLNITWSTQRARDVNTIALVVLIHQLNALGVSMVYTYTIMIAKKNVLIHT